MSHRITELVITDEDVYDLTVRVDDDGDFVLSSYLSEEDFYLSRYQISQLEAAAKILAP